MTFRLPCILATVVLSMPAATSRADTLVHDFEGKNLPSLYTVHPTTTANFSATLTGSALKLSKPSGQNSGRILIQSTSYLSGDFDFVAEISRGSGDCSKGISVNTESEDAAQNLYCSSGQRLLVSSNSAIGGFIGAPSQSSTATMKMRIQRVGDTLASIIDRGTGAGWQTVFSRSNPRYVQPMQVMVFSMVEVASSTADTFEIGKLSLEFNGISNWIHIPAMEVRPGVEMILPTFSLNRYQIQVSSALGNTVWTDLGIPIQGTGQNVLIYDFTQGLPSRFYRAKLTD